jgi:uncharacterized protein YebE (UPF0316 family)
MEPFVIMALVLCEVALWQWRVAITMRGKVLGGVVLALVGAVIQVTAISRVVQDMGDMAKIVGYACGVGIGVLLGCLIDRRLSVWSVTVRVFAPADPLLVPALRAGGWPVTATSGHGHEGPVDVLYVAIDKRLTAELERALRSLAPAACWTIERISASRGLLAFASA